MIPARFNGVFEVLAAPRANDYYVRLGFEHDPRAWIQKGEGR